MPTARNLLSRLFHKAAFTIEPPRPTKNVSDEFVDWLCFANAGMLDRGNLYLMDYALQHLPSDAPILEIGTFCGLSANLLTHFKRKYGVSNRLITCDKWQFEKNSGDDDHIGSSPILFSDYKTFVRDSYIRNARTFSADDLPFTVELLSDEFFAAWKEKESVQDVFGRPLTLGGPLSFCYIDGAHSYDGAKKDFLNCDAFLDPGGFLLFDDSTLEIFGVRHLMPEVLQTGRYELVDTNPNHLFRKLKT
jgi:hypothetical protein